MNAKQRTAATGFTLTEFLVLIGVGSVLAGVLLADLTQARTKLFQQACAANMKLWGMAFDLYAKDYNNRLYYDVSGYHWDDVSSGSHSNVYLPYLGGDSSATSICTIRICPARIGKTDFATTYSYDMPIGNYKRGLNYARADAAGTYLSPNPFWDIASSSYFPSFQFLPQPSSFLLLVESRGNTLYCGGLIAAITQLHSGSGGDSIPAIDRHDGGGVNCLFGDFHVEFVSSQVISNDHPSSICANPGDPWFMLN